ncbi:MAG: YdcF family protein [Clostridium sp.]|uniref:YdcF family protein n=1 Tax=Clostridium sp. TaxID=1506 RepID=UPI0039EC81A2
MLLIVIVIVISILLAFINLSPLLFYKKPLIKLKRDKFDTIIILGYPATKDGRPSPIMRERVIKAVELFNKGYAKYIICSGGSAHNKYREADIMINLAESLGVPESSLIKEDKSINTYGNIINSIEIMKKRKWSSVIVVTSPWHLKRSNYLLSKFDITYAMKKSAYPKKFSILFIMAIYIFENYTMAKNKIIFH